MKFFADNLYHIYNQGNNRQQIFSNREDYLIFLREIRRCISPFCEIVSYCLMPNHFHLVSYVDERINSKVKQGGLILDPLVNGIRKLLSGYTRIFNNHNDRSGSLFRQKTKCKCLTDRTLVNPRYTAQEYTTNCFNYIHQNPLRAGLVSKLEDWEYSSYLDFAGLRNGTLCNKALARKFCGYNEETFVQDTLGSIDFPV